MSAEVRYRLYANPDDDQSRISSEFPQIPLDQLDANRKVIVGRVSGPIRFVTETKADTVSKVAKYTRFIVVRGLDDDHLELQPYTPECGQHWQDIKDLDTTPAELAKKESTLHGVDEDDGEGFNTTVEKGRHQKASSTIWLKNHHPKVCVKR